MTLLLESSLRSLLLGLLVWALLRLLRLRDTATETLIWTFVLVVALAMPLLSHYLPQLPVVVPHPAAGSPTRSGPQLAHAVQSAPALLWIGRQSRLLLPAIYSVGLLLCLARLATGLLLTLRLYRRTLPVHNDWARGRQIRTSAALKGPASLAQTILLPADFTAWSAAKLEAVLAHEATHIARGDFFVQLAASLHCAVFWFSPFAWWLQSKLAEIAESASDEAAARRLNDPLLYAEILLDVARRAQAAPLGVAMAKGPLIQDRIDRILCATPNRHLSPPVRMLIVAALTLVALTVASARAAVGEEPASSAAARPAPVSAARGAARSSSPLHRTATAHRHVRASAVARPSGEVAATAVGHEAVSYNPRALLNPVYLAPRAALPAATIVHAGRTFYIRSTERPIAEVSIADGR